MPLGHIDSNSAGSSGGAGNPGGSDKQVQFNDGGSAFGGNSGFTFNKVNGHGAIGPSSTINGGNPEESGPIPPIDDGRYKNALTVFENFTSLSQVGTGQAGGIFTCICVNQTSDDTNTNYVANEFQLLVPTTSPANYGGLVGTIGVASHAGSGSVGYLFGVQSTAINFGVGHVDWQVSNYGFIENDSGTVTDASIFYADIISGIATNKYGLFITDVTGGSNSNYAIYTGLGAVRLGDTITGTAHNALGPGATLNPTITGATSKTVLSVYEQYTSSAQVGQVAIGVAGIISVNQANNDLSTLYTAGYFDAETLSSNTKNYGTLDGCNYTVIHNGSGTIDGTSGINIAILNEGSGIITEEACGVFFIENDGTGHVVDAILADFQGISDTGTHVTHNKYAIRMSDITGGSVSNYSIYGGLGLAHFSDTFEIMDLTTSGDSTKDTTLKVYQLKSVPDSFAFIMDVEQGILTSGNGLICIGMGFFAGTDGSNTDNSVTIVGVQGVAYHSGTGSITLADCYQAIVNSDHAITVGDASNYHALGQGLTAGYTITNKFCNFLGDDLPVSSKFYQIYTGVGQIHFGDKITNYNAIATAGGGVPAIYGVGRFTAQTAAKASVSSYTVGAADGSFEVSANVLVTTATLHSFTATVTYTDEGNTSRTVTMQFSTIAGAFVTAMTNAQGTVPYEGVPLHIRCKASTSITIATVGTFTTVTYNVEGIIKQTA